MLDALCQFIPLQAGQAAFIKEQNLINNLGGTVGYEVRDGYVIFTEDITKAKKVYHVDMQLVVMDLDHYGDFDLLPLPADMAAQIIQEVYQLLMGTPPADKRVDSKAEEIPQKRVVE